MRRRIQPVPLDVPIRLLAPLLRAGHPVGLWVAGQHRPRPVVHRSPRLLISTDLASLLARAERVITWDGARLRTLPGGARRAG